jgi:hypothetical protein
MRTNGPAATGQVPLDWRAICGRAGRSLRPAAVDAYVDCRPVAQPGQAQAAASLKGSVLTVGPVIPARQGGRHTTGRYH